MKRVKQFRYYSATDSRNQPAGLSKALLVSGSPFSEYTIIQLGIQSIPGTQFKLNGSSNPIIIGSTGIYELDLEGLAEITALSFDSKSIDIINEAPSGSLIIDIIYDDGEDE